MASAMSRNEEILQAIIEGTDPSEFGVPQSREEALLMGVLEKIGNIEPSPEQIAEAVSDWLDDHPEATTTVEDGAISYAKLDNSLQGTVDDVGELKTQTEDINNNIYVPMGDGVYRNSSTITVPTLMANKAYRIDILPTENIGSKAVSIGSLSNAGRDQNLGTYNFVANTITSIAFTANDAWTTFRISDNASKVSVTVYDTKISPYFNKITNEIIANEAFDVNSLNSQIVGGLFSKLTWERGSISDSTGENTSNNKRIRCNAFYTPKGSTVTVDSATYDYYVFKYDIFAGAYVKAMDDYASYGTTYTADEDCYLRVVMKVADSTVDIPVADIPTIVSHLTVTLNGLVKSIKSNSDRIKDPLYYSLIHPTMGLEVGKTITPTTGEDESNSNRMRTKNYINGQNRISVSINSGYKFVVQHYYNNETDATSWMTSYYNDNPTGTYRFVVAHNDGSVTMTDADILACGLLVSTTKISNNLDDFLAGKVETYQPDKIGKFLYVDNSGNITGVNLAIDPTAPAHVRVGTYNIGHYSEGQQTPAGTAENAINFRKAIATMGVSVLGTNENDEYFDAAGTMLPRDMVFKNWKYYDVGPLQSYSCNGFASDYAINNVGKIEFPQTTRYAWYCDMDIDGKNVHIVSAHLDFNDITKRRGQITTLIGHCSQYDRCIIMGDFNPFNYSNGSYNDDGQDESVWKNDYKMWTDEGYILANAGYLGTLATIVTTSVHGWEGLPCDNIIVTPNIYVRQIGMISMDYMHDHRPIWADLVIY